MRIPKSLLLVFFAFVLAATQVAAQQPSAGAPKLASDVLIFSNGEKLIGQLQSATDSAVTFKSEMAGVVTVDWSKVQELQTSDQFAIIPKGIKLKRADDTAGVPKGTVKVADKQVEIAAAQGAPKTMPLSNVSNVVNATAFDNAFRRQSFLHGWKGGATFGLAITQATQDNTTFSSAVSLVRAVPAANWLALRSRTIIDFNQAYGKLTQPGVPSVKTDLLHAGIEQDWYLHPRLFAFASAVFDHSFSQGLDLQQSYGGGLGFVVLKRQKEELDFKAGVSYINQQFQLASLNKKLIGSTFGETYIKTFAHNIFFNEQAGITPAWNDTNAYSAFASAALTFPVYHRLGFTIGAIDNFLNNPPPGFKKNSFQVTVGATYAF